MRSSKRPAIAAVLAAAAVAVALAQLPQAGAATACKPKSNVELILDDSGSMSLFDSAKLRVSGSKLLLRKAAKRKTTFGAVQFGTGASTVFAPGPVATGLAGMEAALDAQIDSDNGATNYNAAFDVARTDNPNADARIFLTDGGHNLGPYLEGHKPGPRTDVIGFGSSTAGGDGERLKRIAGETGGAYYAQTDSSNLQAVMYEVDALQNCLAVPQTYTKAFTAAGQTQTQAVALPASTKSVEAVLTWTGAGNAFDIASARIVRKGRVIAQGSRRKRSRKAKLRLTRSSGATFVTVKIARVRRGSLRLKLRANQLALPTTLTMQVTQSRKR